MRKLLLALTLLLGGGSAVATATPTTQAAGPVCTFTYPYKGITVRCAGGTGFYFHAEVKCLTPYGYQVTRKGARVLAPWGTSTAQCRSNEAVLYRYMRYN